MSYLMGLLKGSYTRAKMNKEKKKKDTEGDRIDLLSSEHFYSSSKWKDKGKDVIVC